MNDRTDPSRRSRRSHPSTGRPAGARHLASAPVASSTLVISCDECSMQCTAACTDCVVSFVLQHDAGEPLVLDGPEERAVRLLAKAGLVPELQYHVAG